MSDLNNDLCASVLAVMSERAVSMRAVARLLDRSAGYVSGRLTGRHALSVDILAAAAQVAHMSERAFMAAVMRDYMSRTVGPTSD
ncbi:hypothetical protein [Cellulomonas xiejunii]|uniref:XRE family transcriptional regulator n=1 Tax=Cellulomonas xiejunii TaxID=2968083 RepID=A0ABY5KN56_9CELL|nr:hypothetical protein [Cellulomonas xiejunii]MCC2319724.1 hypothetical protein [Cellulomonas xiejunii]UUI71338.1 hypothetical protein NP048_16320 [Cellulomonas xiejunii]